VLHCAAKTCAVAQVEAQVGMALANTTQTHNTRMSSKLRACAHEPQKGGTGSLKRAGCIVPRATGCPRRGVRSEIAQLLTFKKYKTGPVYRSSAGHSSSAGHLRVHNGFETNVPGKDT